MSGYSLWNAYPPVGPFSLFLPPLFPHCDLSCILRIVQKYPDKQNVCIQPQWGIPCLFDAALGVCHHLMTMHENPLSLVLVLVNLIPGFLPCFLDLAITWDSVLYFSAQLQKKTEASFINYNPLAHLDAGSLSSKNYSFLGQDLRDMKKWAGLI